MKVTIFKKEVGKYNFICTKILGQEITFDKAATAQLKTDGLGKPGDFDLSDRYQLYGTKSKDGKYVNLHIGIRKDDPAESKGDDDLPF